MVKRPFVDNFNTDARISVFHGIIFKAFCKLTSRLLHCICYLQEKNNNYIEFEVHLIHNNNVPLLHNAVLIYAMKEMDWWPCVYKRYCIYHIPFCMKLYFFFLHQVRQGVSAPGF